MLPEAAAAAAGSGGAPGSDSIAALLLLFLLPLTPLILQTSETGPLATKLATNIAQVLIGERAKLLVRAVAAELLA